MNAAEAAACRHSAKAWRLHKAWLSVEAAAGNLDMAMAAYARGRDKEALRVLKSRLTNLAIKLKLRLDEQMKEPPDGESTSH